MQLRYIIMCFHYYIAIYIANDNDYVCVCDQGLRKQVLAITCKIWTNLKTL